MEVFQIMSGKCSWGYLKLMGSDLLASSSSLHFCLICQNTGTNSWLVLLPLYLKYYTPFFSVIHLMYLFLSQGCSLVVLNHDDIYSDTVRPFLILQMEYLADILIRAEPWEGICWNTFCHFTRLNFL